MVQSMFRARASFKSVFDPILPMGSRHRTHRGEFEEIVVLRVRSISEIA